MQAAERDFETQHLDPRIEAAQRRSWPDWAARTTARITFVVDRINAGHPAMALRSLETLRDDLDRRIRIAADLAADRRARPFPTVTGDGPPSAHTEPPTSPPLTRGLGR